MATSDSPLSVPNVTLAVARSASPPPSTADFSYFENFEGFEKDTTLGVGYNKTLNDALPVNYADSRTLVSIDDPITALPETVPYAPSNPKIAAANPGAGRTGGGTNCAIKFTYAALTGEWSEQAYELNPSFLNGAGGLVDTWVQYDTYIPANFYHPSHTETGGAGVGRKIYGIHSDGYSLENGIAYPTLIIGANPGANGVSLRTVAMQWKDPDKTYGVDPDPRAFGGGGINAGGETDVIVDPAVDAGHWQRRTIRIKMASGHTAEDGIIQLWNRRLMDTATPMAPQKIGERLAGNWHDPERNYMNKGKIIGLKNDRWLEQMTFLITNVIISSSIDDIDQTAIN